MSNNSKLYLNNLINELDIKCKKSKVHNEKYRASFANYRSVAGFNSTLKELMFTLIIKHSDGAYITDVDENKYVDITMGFGVHLFGHSPEFIKNVIHQQLEKGYSLGPLFEDAAKVAQLIQELTGVDRSAFFNSGTEAVMVSMRLAKAFTGKDKIVIFSGAYHGTFDSLLSMRANADSRQATTHVPGITNNILCDTIILRYGREESLEFIKKNKDSIAAVLSEPIQSRNPGFRPKEFVSDLRSLCTDSGIVLIFDEIITGFRYSNSGASGYFKVKPDLVTYGKTIGGGMPIGVVAGKKEIMDYIDGGQWNFGDNSFPQSKTTFVAGTFCHHPLSMSVTKSVLELLKKDTSIQENLNLKTTEFCEKLNSFFVSNSISIKVENFGSLYYFILRGPARYLFYGLLNEGIYIWEGRTCFLSTAHSDTDIKYIFEKIKKVCFKLRQAGII